MARSPDITPLFAFYGTTQNFHLFYNPESNYLDSLRQAGLNNQDVLRFGQDIYNRETVIARSQPESTGIHLYRCLNEGRRPTPPLDRDTSTAYKPLFHHALDISRAPHLFDRYVSFAFKEASIHNPFTASHPLQPKGHQPNYESMANCVDTDWATKKNNRMLMTLTTPFQAVPSNQAINEQLAKPWSSASEHYPALPISATAEHKAMASTIRIARERTKVDGPMEVFLATRANIIGLVEIVRCVISGSHTKPKLEEIAQVLLTDAGDSSSILKRIRSWVNLLDIAIHFSPIVALTCSRLEDVTASLLLKLSFLCAGKKSTDVIRAEDLIWQTIFKLARPPHSLSFATASPNNLLGIGSRRCDPEIFDLLSSLQSYLTPAKSQIMSIIRWDPPVSKSRQGRTEKNNSPDAVHRQREQQQRDAEELETAGEQETPSPATHDARSPRVFNENMMMEVDEEAPQIHTNQITFPSQRLMVQSNGFAEPSDGSNSPTLGTYIKASNGTIVGTSTESGKLVDTQPLVTGLLDPPTRNDVDMEDSTIEGSTNGLHRTKNPNISSSNVDLPLSSAPPSPRSTLTTLVHSPEDNEDPPPTAYAAGNQGRGAPNCKMHQQPPANSPNRPVSNVSKREKKSKYISKQKAERTKRLRLVDHAEHDEEIDEHEAHYRHIRDFDWTRYKAPRAATVIVSQTSQDAPRLSTQKKMVTQAAFHKQPDEFVPWYPKDGQLWASIVDEDEKRKRDNPPEAEKAVSFFAYAEFITAPLDNIRKAFSTTHVQLTDAPKDISRLEQIMAQIGYQNRIQVQDLRERSENDLSCHRTTTFEELLQVMEADPDRPINALDLPAGDLDNRLPRMLDISISHSVFTATNTDDDGRKIFGGQPTPANHFKWNLFTTKDGFSAVHADALGFATAIRASSGAIKHWAIAIPKPGKAYDVWDARWAADFDAYKINVGDYWWRIFKLDDTQILFMMPATWHAVYTASTGFFMGEHYYSISHADRNIVGAIHTLIWDAFTTNASHPGIDRMLWSRCIVNWYLVISRSLDQSWEGQCMNIARCVVPLDFDSLKDMKTFVLICAYHLLCPALDMTRLERHDPALEGSAPPYESWFDTAVKYQFDILSILAENYELTVNGEVVQLVDGFAADAIFHLAAVILVMYEHVFRDIQETAKCSRPAKRARIDDQSKGPKNLTEESEKFLVTPDILKHELIRSLRHANTGKKQGILKPGAKLGTPGTLSLNLLVEDYRRRWDDRSKPFPVAEWWEGGVSALLWQRRCSLS